MRWWVVAAGVLALASCSDGDGETAVVEAGTAPPTAPESAPAAPVTTTTPPVPATEPSTTSTTTTSPPTTTTPPTTVDPAIASAEQVEADYLEGWSRFRLAQQDPNDEAASAAALEYVSGQSLDAAIDSLATLRREGLRILPSPPIEPRVAIEWPPDRAHGNLVQIRACVIDPWVLVETGAGPEGADAIVDDNVYAYRNLVTMVEVGDIWTVSDSVEIGRWVGSESCGPS